MASPSTSPDAPMRKLDAQEAEGSIRPRIIIVDDDAFLRGTMARILEREGYQVTQAVDGDQALAHYRKKPADLVIVDAYMPKMNGLVVINELIKEFPKVSIMAVSAGGLFDNATTVLQRAALLGAVRTLAKPFDREKLVEVVAEALAASELAESSCQVSVPAEQRAPRV